MLDDLSFLRVICASPDDDAPRLLYADYLDEKGDAASAARAEFIRVQCAIAAARTDDGNIDYLKQRERVLLTEHLHDWIRPTCLALGEPVPNRSNSEWELEWLHVIGPHDHIVRRFGHSGIKFRYFASTQFRRGFIAHVALFHKESRGERHVARLWDQAPVDGLTLAAFDGAGVERILAAIEITRLRSLELIFTGDATVKLVSTHPRLVDLRELMVQGVNDKIDVAETIGSSTTLSGIRILILNQCSVDEGGIARLCRSAVATRLQRLELVDCDVNNDSVMHLSRYWPTTNNLTHLDLSSNRVTVAGQRVLQDRFGDALKFKLGQRSWPTRFYL